MVRYVHGSEDDISRVCYVFDRIPGDVECNSFCSKSHGENRDIISIRKGIVSYSFAGLPDEVNNSLIDTYSLHQQEYPLMVMSRVERNVPIKQIKSVETILNLLRNTIYRSNIKKALKSGWGGRMECIRDIDIASMGYNSIARSMDAGKTMGMVAFQIGQGLGLLDGKELYTRKSIASAYPLLKDCLYEGSMTPVYKLDCMMQEYADALEEMEFSEKDGIVYFPKYGKKYDFRKNIEVPV